MTARTDANTGLTETFNYDNLNRLTKANPSGQVAITLTYDALGNITSKSDVGTYVYPLAGQPLVHAVQSIVGTVNGVVNPAYSGACPPAR